MKIKSNAGYSVEVANKYVDPKRTFVSLSIQLEAQQKWEDGRPTGEIQGYRAWFVQEGTEPFWVKFPTKVKLPDFVGECRLQKLEACEVGRNVYFKASDIERV